MKLNFMDIPCFRCLLSAGMDVDRFADTGTPLHDAIYHGRYETVQFLLRVRALNISISVPPHSAPTASTLRNLKNSFLSSDEKRYRG